jgi:hypothetical protein
MHRFPSHHVPLIRVMFTNLLIGFYDPDEAVPYTIPQATPLTLANGSASACTRRVLNWSCVHVTALLLLGGCANPEFVVASSPLSLLSPDLSPACQWRTLAFDGKHCFGWMTYSCEHADRAQY